MGRSRLVTEKLLMFVLVVGVSFFVAYTRPVDVLELAADDYATAYLTSDITRQHPGVAIVAIDEAAIGTLPVRSPMDRPFLARLITLVDSARPTAIGIDILFDKPSHDPADDAALLAALAGTRTPVVILTGHRGGERLRLAPAYENGGSDIALGNLPVNRGDRTLRDYRTAFADRDGTLHDILAVVLARYGGVAVQSSTEDRLIDWYGRPGLQGRSPGSGPAPILTLPALKLLDGSFDIQRLEGRIVIVGATYDGLADRLLSPFKLLQGGNPSFYGVEAHAQILAQLLDGRSRSRTGPALTIAALIAAALMGMALGLWSAPVVASLSAAVAIPLLWTLGVFAVRYMSGHMLPVASPVFAFWLAMTGFALIRGRRLSA